MRIGRVFLVAAFLLSWLNAQNVKKTETGNKNVPTALEGLSFSGQWFLAYTMEEENKKSFNEFKLRRGYVTVKKKFNKYFSARITQDIAVDHEGDGEGDVEIRLKYGYLRYGLDKLFFLSKPFMEFGIVHRPWLDFEQKINIYRVQGTMFLERYTILRSADYGVTINGFFYGEMNEDYKKKVNKNYPVILLCSPFHTNRHNLPEVRELHKETGVS